MSIVPGFIVEDHQPEVTGSGQDRVVLYSIYIYKYIFSLIYIKFSNLTTSETGENSGEHRLLTFSGGEKRTEQGFS